MSRYYSMLDLYHAITNNNVDKLRDALFYLGWQVHCVKLWSDYTPLLYAAKLAHVRQARILYNNLMLYKRCPQNTPGTNRISVHRGFPVGFEGDESQRDYTAAKLTLILLDSLTTGRDDAEYMEFLLEMLTTTLKKWSPKPGSSRRISTFHSTPEEKVLRKVFKNQASDLVEKAVGDDEYLFQGVLDYCIETGFQEILKFSKWKNRPEELNSNSESEVESNDPLQYAIVHGNHEGVVSILERFRGRTGCIDPPWRSLSIVKAPSVYVDFKITGRPVYLVKFIRDLIVRDDVSLFQVVMDFIRAGTHCPVLYHPGGTPLTLMRYVQYFAAANESCKILTFLLGCSEFDVSKYDWLVLYHHWTLCGLLKSAAKVKHLVNFDDAEKREKLFKHYGESEDTPIPFDTPANDLHFIIETIEALPKTKPTATDTECHWRRKIVTFPKRARRPDLLKSFRKYGTTDTESVVLKEVADYIKWASVQLLNLHYNVLIPLERKIFIDLFFGDLDPVRSDDSSEDNLMTACVRESGKRVLLLPPDEPLEDAAAMGTIPDFAKERREHLTLKKLCRLSIRSNLIKSHCKSPLMDYEDWVNLSDAIISLYVDGHLPKDTVEYLLYRDSGMYHALMEVWIR